MHAKIAIRHMGLVESAEPLGLGTARMRLLEPKTEEAVSLLTELADGDVALVLAALEQYGDDDVDKVMEFIEKGRDEKRRVAIRHEGPGLK